MTQRCQVYAEQEEQNNDANAAQLPSAVAFVTRYCSVSHMAISLTTFRCNVGTVWQLILHVKMLLAYIL